MKVPRKHFFTAIIALAKSHPVELFLVASILLHICSLEEVGEVSVARCNQFATYVADKINQILLDLGSGLSKTLEVQDTPSGLILWGEYSVASPEEVNRTVGEIRLTTGMLDSCRSWLIKEATGDFRTGYAPLDRTYASTHEGGGYSTFAEEPKPRPKEPQQFQAHLYFTIPWQRD